MFENIKRITRVGAPSFNVPPTMTALEALEAMNIDHTTMDVKIEGDNLILAAQSGSKG